MKKTIVLLMLFCLLVSTVLALVPFTGAPSVPYLVFGVVDWQSQGLGGVRIKVTNTATGYTETFFTNIDGYWQTGATNWLTNNKNRPPVFFGDIITVRSLDGCGTNDICEKTFTALDTGNEFFGRIDLSLTGVLIGSPPSSSSSSGGGGGGGGTPVPWDCQEWSVCSNGQQVHTCTYRGFRKKETQDCVLVPKPDPKPPVVEPPVVEPPIGEPEPPVEEPEVPKEKPEIPKDVPEEPEDDLFIRLLGLAAIILGALGVQWYRGILGIVKYHWKKGNKVRAIKTLFTLIKKAQEGAYDKKK